MAPRKPEIELRIEEDENGPFCKIPLSTRGKSASFAKIDPGDFAEVAQFNWQGVQARQNSEILYARRCLPSVGIEGQNRKRPTEQMANRILGQPPTITVDHANGDGLDNRRNNIRVASVTQNHWNTAKKKNLATSRFKGVSWDKKGRRWNVRICANGRNFWVGSFRQRPDVTIYEAEIAAARRYDQAAITLFGPFARLNFPEKRNFVTLKEGDYKMRHVFNDDDTLRLNQEISDLSAMNKHQMLGMLFYKTFEEIEELCRFLNCGVEELPREIRKTRKS